MLLSGAELEESALFEDIATPSSATKPSIVSLSLKNWLPLQIIGLGVRTAVDAAAAAAANKTRPKCPTERNRFNLGKCAQPTFKKSNCTYNDTNLLLKYPVILNPKVNVSESPN